MLRVANVSGEEVLETVRDVLDQLGLDYEHIRSEPDEDTFPQTAYFYVDADSAANVEELLARLSGDLGYDAEVI
jgi:hypothetical protein